ncbi:hypothetical protein, partial [Rhodoblastus acidophilus]|uniref:hypothetical protein n=1 Tax=Rhodoblastus acidophilus TaxID=1074 RepID=UPI001AECF04F
FGALRRNAARRSAERRGGQDSDPVIRASHIRQPNVLNFAVSYKSVQTVKARCLLAWPRIPLRL